MNRLFGTALVGLLSGCIFLPRTTSQYNADCEIYERKMVLESYQVATVAGCSNEGCVAILAAAGVVSAATAVVSGSVVVVGNVVYWLEKKGKCVDQKQVGTDDNVPPLRSPP